MKTFYCGPKGGLLQVFDPETGEVLSEHSLSSGPHPMAELARLAGARAWDVSGGHWLAPRGNMQTCKPDGQFESAANPTFRVSPAQRQARELRRMLARTEALQRRTQKQLQAIERARAAPHVVDAPAPASTPAPADAAS